MKKFTRLAGMSLLFLASMLAAQGGGGGNGGGGGGGAVVPSGPDTTYHTVTNTIYSITERDPGDTSLATKYTVYFLDGTIQYYCTYEYTNKILAKINYYDGNNKMYAYGIYASNKLKGFDYLHYASDGALISKTEYDALWISNQFTAYTAEQKMMYTVSNTISKGYITNEKYYNEKNILVGEGVWSWIPTTQVTLYTYTVKNGTKQIHGVTGDEYDIYEIYYHNYLKDSLKLYNGVSNLVYTATYSYDANGYMTNDKYYIRGELKSSGHYTFDKNTFKTTYTYSLAPDTLLWKTTYDYRYLYEKTEYFSRDNKVESVLTYEYDTYFNYSKVSKKDAAGTLLGYETYTYYDPYSILKEYATFDAKNTKTSYKIYDLYGNKTDEMVGIDKHRSASIAIADKRQPGYSIFFDIKGRVVGNSNGMHQISRRANGVYLLNTTNDKRVTLQKK